MLTRRARSTRRTRWRPPRAIDGHMLKVDRTVFHTSAMALEPKNECTRASLLSKALASIAFPCKFACEIRRGRRAPREPASQGKRGGPRAPRVEFTRASWSKCARPPHEAHVSNSKDGARGKQQPTSLLRRGARVDLTRAPRAYGSCRGWMVDTSLGWLTWLKRG